MLDYLFLISLDCNREDEVARTNIVDNIFALYDLAEAGVYAVEVLRVATIVADKELRATRILATMRHREDASVVILALGIGLARNCPARTTCAIADRAAALNDKFGNYAVKCQAVVEARLGKFDEVSDCDRGLFLVEFDLHIALFGRDNSVSHSLVI